MSCVLLSHLSKDVRAAIWRDYLGEHSMSIALLRCTSSDMREELKGFELFVSPLRLDRCDIDVVESVLPKVSDQSVDLCQWLGLFCSAASAGNFSIVLRLLAIGSTTNAIGALATGVFTAITTNVPTPQADLMWRALSDVHDHIKATRNWRAWEHIHDGLGHKTLQNLLLSLCFVERHTMNERLLRLTNECFSHALRYEYQRVAPRAFAKMIGIAIGRKGTAGDFAVAAAIVPADFMWHLQQSCSLHALKAGRFDGFVSYFFPSSYFDDTILWALQCDNTAVLEFAMSRRYDFGQPSDTPILDRFHIALYHTVESGNARACRLLLDATGGVLPSRLSINCSQVFAVALLRSVDDARFFLDAYLGMANIDDVCRHFITPEEKLSESVPFCFWKEAWQQLLRNLAAARVRFHLFEPPSKYVLDEQRLLFFLETASATVGSDMDRLFRFILESLVTHLSFSETLADTLLPLIHFNNEEERREFGKSLAIWACLDAAYDWACLRFPGSQVSAAGASRHFANLIGPLTSDTFTDIRYKYLFNPPSATSTMRLLNAGGDIVPLLAAVPSVTHSLPPSATALLLQRHADALPGATLPNSILTKIAVRLYDRGQKRVFCKFYDSVFRPVEDVVKALRSAISFPKYDPSRANALASNCRVRSWLLRNEPQVYRTFSLR